MRFTGSLNRFLRIFTVGLLIILLTSICTEALPVNPPDVPAPRILFDDSHGQSFGNADWTPHHAYSDFADDLRLAFNASVFASSLYDDGKITSDLLSQIDLVILPEPNLRYSTAEVIALRRFVSQGGALFLIADHGGSDRNFDGWDSSLILNELVEGWGITFLGDTFSETPVTGKKAYNSCILKGIEAVGAWAATSIAIDKNSWHWLPVIHSGKTGHPFIVTGEIGLGRVIAMGDSSAFDDGSGDTSKNRHSSYHSWMFYQRQMGIQSVCWLLKQEPGWIPERDLPFPDRDASSDLPENAFRLVIDAANGNNDADLTERFGLNIKQALRIPVALNLHNMDGLRSSDILLLTNPSSRLSDEDISVLADWVRNQGGRLILAGASARNPLSSIPDMNRLLEELKSTMRLNADQILDYTSNTGKPWSIKAPLFANLPELQTVDSAIFWGVASITNRSGQRLRNSDTVTVLAWTSADGQSQVKPFFTISGGQQIPEQPVDYTPEDGSKTKYLPDHVDPRAIPIAAMEKTGEGTVVLLGADPFTDFQYPTEQEKATLEPIKWDHRTPEFNLALMKILTKVQPGKSAL